MSFQPALPVLSGQLANGCGFYWNVPLSRIVVVNAHHQTYDLYEDAEMCPLHGGIEGTLLTFCSVQQGAEADGWIKGGPAPAKPVEA